MEEPTYLPNELCIPAKEDQGCFERPSFSPLQAVAEKCRNRILREDPAHLRRLALLTSLVGACALSLATGVQEAGATDLVLATEPGDSLANTIIEYLGRNIPSLSNFPHPDVIQQPEEGFLSKLADFLVDGAESVGDIYGKGKIFSQDHPRMAAGILAGILHAAQRTKDLASMARRGYWDIVLGPVEDPSKQKGEKKSIVARILHSLNPVVIAKDSVLMTHYMDSLLTAVTVANLHATPAHILNIGILMAKYKVTDMSFKNLMRLDDLIAEKRELEWQGQQISFSKIAEFMIRVIPGIAILGMADMALTLVLAYKYLSGEEPV